MQSPKPLSRREWGYRPELDGLRSIAVFLVVAFHAGLASFSGGFVGVDLFFVLSGFLVTNVIMTEVGTGDFKVFRFYSRRVRRLLPSAIATIVGASILLVAVATPAARLRALPDAKAASLYFANWHFLSQSQDYFAAEDTAGPFQHFWSLAIEEQFYIAFPILILALAKLTGFTARFERYLLASAAVLLGLGIGRQLQTGRSNTNYAYFATDARIYQILAGVVLALLVRKYGLPRLGFLSWIGIASLVFLSMQVDSLTPSSRGLLACAASVGIVTGLEAKEHGALNQLLRRPALVYLGGISYSIYLWHWPFVVAAKVVFPTISPAALFSFVALAATAAAALSDVLLERPIRSTKSLRTVPQITVALGLVLSVTTALVLVPPILENDRPAFASGAIPAAPDAGGGAALTPVPANLDWQAAVTDVPVEPDCIHKDVTDCILVEGEGLRIHLVGDSHAKTLIPLFEKLAEEHDWTFSATVIGGCPWQEGMLYVDNELRTERCKEQQTDWYDRIIPELDPDIVFLFHRAYRDPAFGREMSRFDGPVEDMSQAEFISIMSEQTVDDLVEEGRRVVIIEPIPVSSNDPTECLSGATYLEDCAFEATIGYPKSEDTYGYLDTRSESVLSLDIDTIVCPDFPTCLPMVDDLIVRRDRHHLTGTFSEHIANDVYDLLDASGILKSE